MGNAFSGCTGLSSINLVDTILKNIGGIDNADVLKDAFKQCTSLTTIEFPETLELIGYNAFYMSGLSETIRIPDNVTSLAPGALLSTEIETIILGAGAIQIGNNVMGTYESDKNASLRNAYLKNIYIPIEATFSNASLIWYVCQNTVNFYVIANEAQIGTKAFDIVTLNLVINKPTAAILKDEE